MFTSRKATPRSCRNSLARRQSPQYGVEYMVIAGAGKFPPKN
jgi:hypothetical protein